MNDVAPCHQLETSTKNTFIDLVISGRSLKQINIRLLVATTLLRQPDNQFHLNPFSSGINLPDESVELKAYDFPLTIRKSQFVQHSRGNHCLFLPNTTSELLRSYF